MTKFSNKIRKFSSNQENHLEDVQKSFEAFEVANCMSFIEDSVQSSTEVAPFIKLSVIQKFYCHCFENLKAPVWSANATRLKENLLKLNKNLEVTSRKKDVFISFKDDLATALEYSREHSLQNNVIHLSRAAHIIHFNTARQKGDSGTSRYTSAKVTALSIRTLFYSILRHVVVC